jgi:hypothetical protein
MECRIFTDPGNGAAYHELLQSAKLAEEFGSGGYGTFRCVDAQAIWLLPVKPHIPCRRIRRIGALRRSRGVRLGARLGRLPRSGHLPPLADQSRRLSARPDRCGQRGFRKIP